MKDTREKKLTDIRSLSLSVFFFHLFSFVLFLYFTSGNFHILGQEHKFQLLGQYKLTLIRWTIFLVWTMFRMLCSDYDTIGN